MTDERSFLRRLVVAIDGPAGSGKSTLAKETAKSLGYLYIDTGAMYRTVTLAAMRQGLNFDDPAALTRIARESLIELKPAEESTRGAASSRWPVEAILSRGYGLATMYYGDIEPDHDGARSLGIRHGFSKPGQPPPGDDGWGAIAAWAWGLSRIADYLNQDKDVDASRLIVVGHSRLGKAALWAGAQDPRFAIVISNDSGEGGAAISRRRFGETVADLNTRFPHWFCGEYRQHSGGEDQMPFDAHMLLALAAPRPLYVASATDDLWADPKGEFLGAVAASEVYALLGKTGLGTSAMPPPDRPVGDTVRYHVRTGKHDIALYDWQQFLDFADRHLATRGPTGPLQDGARVPVQAPNWRRW